MIARNAEHYEHLCHTVTEEAVTEYFKHYITEGGTVTRYLLPGTHALNFVLTHSLGGGGIASLRIDPQVGPDLQALSYIQGKAYAQMLCDLQVPKPDVP